MKRILRNILILSLLVIAACTAKSPYESMSFKDTCRATNGMWMKMQPTKDFIPTGQPACEGCMQRSGDHICDKEAYINSLK